MPDTIDELARKWKARPDAESAIALSNALFYSSPTSSSNLVDELGKHAATHLAFDGDVLFSVARLYSAVERLGDAQTMLVSAGRVAPRDPKVFRLLGEVLLRRGDAERAEKVLERAAQLGANDPETSLWLERAKVFKPVQARAGAKAVANEIKGTGVHPLTPHPDAPASKPATRAAAKPPAVPPARPVAHSVDEEAMTLVRPQLSEEDNDNTLRTSTARRPPGKPRSETDRTIQRNVRDGGATDVSSDHIQRPTGPKLRPTAEDAPTVSRAVLARDLADASDARAALPTYTDERTEIKDQSNLADVVESIREEPRRPVARTAKSASAPTDAVGTGPTASMPAAREVLDALSNAGVFERREASAGPVVWDKPNEKARRRTAIGLSIGMVLFLAGAGGVFFEIQRRRARAHEEAETALAKVEADLNLSKSSLLPSIEQTIGHAFDLDSRSPRAASDWLQERAIKGLLTGGAELAFEDAVARALEVKVPEEKVAFARVSAFLFQGDTGGAAGLMPKWDTQAANQPLYQLVTGSTLERAGDPHAAERYLAATKLSPNLVLADILLARATAIDGDPTKAAELAKQFKAKYPDRPEGSALVALAWGRDPARGEQAPPEVADVIAHGADLPTPLLAIPHAVAAILAADKHAYADAKMEIEKGLAVANDPGVATWLGTIALETRDEALVRKAALTAVSFSAVYAPARVLAGRIALLAGRLDEALKATEDLDPTSPDVAIVRAAAAYERADVDGVGRALEATSADAKKLPILAALGMAPDVLLGREASTLAPADAPAKLTLMSTDEAPWSDLIAMDLALDLGLTDVADKILVDWKGSEEKPLRAVRASRLARYENRLDDADKYSKIALEAGTVTPRVLIERVMLLVAKNRAAEAGPLLARYPLVLGPASSWLSAYALASNGKLDDARGRTAQVDFPPPLAPLPFRIMAAVSLTAMKDKKRAEPAVKDLLATGSADPDLLAAAATLGIHSAAAPPAPGAPSGRKGKR